MADLDILRLDQPENRDRTRDLGNILAEAVRALNYSTLGDAPGLEFPADAYDLLGALCTATMRLPQLLGQVEAFLEAQAVTRTLGEDHGRDPAGCVRAARAALRVASVHATSLAGELRDAQNAIAGLHVKEDGDAQD